MSNLELVVNTASMEEAVQQQLDAEVKAPMGALATEDATEATSARD